MSATAAPVASDRSDFRTVTVGGAKLGVATAVAVVAFLAASRLVPITGGLRGGVEALIVLAAGVAVAFLPAQDDERSEEHTSELQSRLHLVCRLLLEKKKKNKINRTRTR